MPQDRPVRSCLVSLLLLGALLVSQPAGAATSAAPPNIVLIIADDVSVDDLGCYGHPTLRTPHIDALAAGGLRFTNAYLTTSSCSPTRTSLITGRYPHSTGAPELHMTDSPILATLPQFPALLRAAGYYTAQSGKVHFNGDVSASFDDLFGNDGAGPSGGDRWVQCLRERPADRPFFMWFAAHDAHRGWDMPLEQGPFGPADARPEPYHANGPLTRRDLAHYYNEVHRFDDRVGQVVAELRRQDQLDHTLIIVMADNGRPFPRDKTWLYDSGIKTPLVVHWPAGIPRPAAVPALVSVIDLAPTLLDLAGLPAPASLQGVSLRPLLDDPSNATVRDFAFAEHNWHTLRAHERLVRHGNFVYIRNAFPQWMGFNIVHWSQDGSWSYQELAEIWHAGRLSEPARRALGKIHGDAAWDNFRRPRPAEMLFDVSTDPKQLHDLADRPEHAATLALLRRALDQWTADTGDTIPAADAMTPDRVDRETWAVLKGSGRPDPGEVPGQGTRAHTINAKGPVLLGDLR